MLRGSITVANGIVGSSGTAAHIDSMPDVTDRCTVPAAVCAFHFASSRESNQCENPPHARFSGDVAGEVAKGRSRAGKPELRET